ncbi:MAG: helix-turn-helix domain-containing protein [Aquamicrobium sp.]|uniref:helix-turn-helix domain-containing protein n=1 Tax=Aquamicrobium sp. TaxID=1872579 RepID=UPI00349E92DB|nr:helix-turn-helix domain-containing protein [Aquamicrobium sp.]
MPDTTTIYSDIPDSGTLGGRLARARNAAGLSAAQLARRVGVQSATVQSWEDGRSQPHANRLPTLAGVLNVSLSWLLHGVGPAPAEEDPRTAQDLGPQLARLKRLHRETAEIIVRLERHMDRIAAH